MYLEIFTNEAQIKKGTPELLAIPVTMIMISFSPLMMMCEFYDRPCLFSYIRIEGESATIISS